MPFLIEARKRGHMDKHSGRAERLWAGICSILEKPLAKIGMGALFTFIGFLVNVFIQRRTNSSAKEIMQELFKTVDDHVTIGQVGKVLDTFFSPVSFGGIISSLLWFFLGLVVTEFILQTGDQRWRTGLEMENVQESDDIILKLLRHMTDEVYGRCSNSTEHCGSCGKFASEKNGLLRRYLYEESLHLQQEIAKAKSGEYSLDTNIPKFHTLAVTHLLTTLGRRYAVVQWIGSKQYSEKNKYDETFDFLDFDFLNVLLTKVTEGSSGGKSGVPYYMRNLGNGVKFKIQWLLIGEINCMKNNFDYIFYVAKRFSEERNIALDVINGFFEFHVIGEEQYEKEVNILFREQFKGEMCKRLFMKANEPSMEIFGDQFMFVDSLDRSSHGSIYTAQYMPDGHVSLLETSINIFDIILSKAHKHAFADMMTQYAHIIEEDSAWEEHLKSIWNQEKIRKEY